MLSHRNLLRLIVLLGVGLLLSSCAQTVNTTRTPALARAGTLNYIAVVPFRSSGELGRAAAEKRVLALQQMAHQMSEAMGKTGVKVIPPSDVTLLMGDAPPAGERWIPREVAARLNAEYGVNAILMGEGWRFRERSGQAAGTRVPASVGFEVTLYAAPGGQRLWTGTFDETQKPLGENVLATTQYPGGGLRWLTAEELLRWGADQTVISMPISP